MTQDRMIEFAVEFDPQPFHTDPEAAAESSFGQLVASGWHTGSAMMRLIAGYVGEASMGAIGVDELRWHRPVVPGDELRLTWTVEETRRSQSKPDRGVVRVRQEMKNRDGSVVMSFVALMLFRARSS